MSLLMDESADEVSLFSGQMQFLTGRLEMLKSQIQVKEDLERVRHMFELERGESRILFTL